MNTQMPQLAGSTPPKAWARPATRTDDLDWLRQRARRLGPVFQVRGLTVLADLTAIADLLQNGPIEAQRPGWLAAEGDGRSPAMLERDASGLLTAWLSERDAGLDNALEQVPAWAARWAEQASFELLPELGDLISNVVFSWLFDQPGPSARLLRLHDAAGDDALGRLAFGAVDDSVARSPLWPQTVELAASWRFDRNSAARFASQLASDHVALPLLRVLFGLTAGLALSPRLAGRAASSQEPERRTFATHLFREGQRLFPRPASRTLRLSSNASVRDRSGRPWTLKAERPVVLAYAAAARDAALFPDPDRLRPERHAADPSLLSLLPPWSTGGLQRPVPALSEAIARIGEAVLMPLIAARWSAAPLPSLDPSIDLAAGPLDFQICDFQPC